LTLTDPSGIAALNHEVTRQAAMIAYNDDFAIMLIVIFASLPLLLLVRAPRRQPLPAAADDWSQPPLLRSPFEACRASPWNCGN
jgi:hypothetical protein